MAFFGDRPCLTAANWIVTKARSVLNFEIQLQTRAPCSVFTYNDVHRAAPNEGSLHKIAPNAAVSKHMLREMHCDRPRYLEDPTDP
jgi:hypothetical protein